MMPISPDRELPADPELSERIAKKYPLALPMGSILNGKFFIKNVLGQGGFGITYLALDLKDQSFQAVKEYMPQHLSTRTLGTTEVIVNSSELAGQYSKGLGDFLREGQILSSFNGDPQIVGARRFFEENGTAYLVMEYIEGQSLKERLKEAGGILSWQETLKIMRPILQALGRVHRAGICHRDVAPDNIYITPEGNVKLLDFGAARFDTGDRSMTVLLKPGFTPFEQYTRKGKQGSYTDVYAAAATMYRCITGHLPPDSVDRAEEDTLPTISSYGIPTPKSLEDAIIKGLAVMPQDRFQTMEEFLSAFSKAEQEIPEIRRDSEKKPAPLAPEEAPKSRKKLWIGAAAGALVLLCGAGILISALGKQSPQDGTHTEASILAEGENLTPEEALLRQAEAGDPEAQFRMGQNCTDGIGGPIDYAQAAHWYELAAQQGHVTAQYQMGLISAQGKGISKDEAAALGWFEKAAEQNLSAAQYEAGMALMNGVGTEPDPVQGFSWLKKSADQGHPQAQYQAAQCLESGTGTETDPETAAALYSAAADQGHPEAKFHLARCLYDGRGADHDFPRAAALFEEVAREGYFPAQIWTAYCYEYNQGVPYNSHTAEDWYNRAAEGLSDFLALDAQDPDSLYALGLFYSLGNYDRSREFLDSQKGGDYFQRAAELGHVPAIYLYGLWDHFNMELVRQAAEAGCAEAIYQLGYQCWSTDISQESRAKAVGYWKIAAQMGDLESAAWIGVALSSGQGIPQDHEKAVEIFRYCTERGNITAATRLALAYAQGTDGLSPDRQKAHDLLQDLYDRGCDFILSVMKAHKL